MTFARMKSTGQMGFINSILFIILSITSFYQSIVHLPIVAANHVLQPGDELNSLDFSSILISANGVFTLGFFTTPSSNFTYLGIWKTNEKQNNQVWVANRDIPFIGEGVLRIDDSPILKVMNANGTTLFNISNDQVGSNNIARAMLNDSGNLIAYDKGNRTLWQSFDYPTDTLLSGMKLGYNLTTKQNWTLTSWLSDEVPSSGAFTMRLEQYQNSTQLLIYRRGELYRASGPWSKITGKSGTFQYLQWIYKGDSVFQYDQISDHSGMYLSGANTMYLSPKGELGIGANTIVDATLCFGNQAFDESVVLISKGCVSTLPYCRGQLDTTYRWESSDWYYGSADSPHHDYNSSIGLGDCMERCRNDCNCTRINTIYENGTGCRTWSGDPSDPTYYLSNDSITHASDQPGQKYSLVSIKPLKVIQAEKNKNRKWKLVVSLASVIASVLAAAFCFVMIRRRRLEVERRMKDDYIHQTLEKGIQDAPGVKILSFEAILTATDNFSNENKLGQGGYGPVYKGKLSDGREIAVKRLSKTSGQGIQEFKSELILISKLQHTNLVRLYGCCIHQEEKMLIYEFMPNKSLDFFLFAEDKKEKLDWRIRFNIIEGVAQGLLYLHKYSRMKVIHRDLKVSNVLLDENMNPKIADFGTARIFKQNVTEDVTNRVVGTYGYMAPEYAMEGTFSIKSDVFSFGVLILEIVSGRRNWNSSFYNLDRPLNLVGYAWELWKGQAALQLKDNALGETCDVKQLLRTVHVGLLCVQENADDRPTMSEVISMLNNEIADLPSPKQPAFFTGRQAVEGRSPETRSTDYLLDEIVPVSVNGLTITKMEAR